MKIHNLGIVDPFSSDKKRFLIKAEHYMRYVFAKDVISKFHSWSGKGEIIYDLGCGKGYGVKILVNNKKSKVYGFDKEKLYTESLMIDFETEKIDSFMKKNKLLKPDVIVCFETIEHLQNPLIFLKQVHNILKNEGTFICSIPQKKYESGSEIRNSLHPQQMTHKDSRILLENAGFEMIEEYGQPISNMIMRYGKKLSHYLNKIAFKSSKGFETYSRLFAYPTRFFANISYSVIYVCKKT